MQQSRLMLNQSVRDIFIKTTESTDVLVVGGGPVGLWSAVLLSQQKIPFKVIERQQRFGMSNYALTLHSRTLRMLEGLGFIDEVLRVGKRVDKIAIYEGSVRTGGIDISLLDGPYPYLIILPQSFLEDLFERRLREDGAQILTERSLKNLDFERKDITATITESEAGSFGRPIFSYLVGGEEKIRASFVIGADGYNSSVRKLLEVPFDVIAEPELFAIIEFETDIRMKGEARLTIGPLGRNILWPLPNGRCRGVFQLHAEDVEEISHSANKQKSTRIGDDADLFIDDLKALNLVKKRSPSFSGNIGTIYFSQIVQFERRLARVFGRNSVWLCGDSARTNGPIGVQSICGIC